MQLPNILQWFTNLLPTPGPREISSKEMQAKIKRMEARIESRRKKESKCQ